MSLRKLYPKYRFKTSLLGVLLFIIFFYESQLIELILDILVLDNRCYRAIFPPQSGFPPEKWLGEKTTIGALQSHFPPIASFPPRKNDYIVGFPPGKLAIQWNSPRKNGYIVGFPPERMTTQQPPSENGLYIQLSCSVKFYYHLPVPLLVDSKIFFFKFNYILNVQMKHIYMS